MKTKMMLLALLSFFALNSVRGQGIKFEDKLTWEEVKAKAARENKNIFIDFFTTWCGPCKAMDENVYPIKELGDYFNTKYVSIKVQIDSTGNDTEAVKAWRQTAKMMEKTYPIPAYPTMYFVESSGKPLMRTTGLQSAEALIKMAEISSDPNSSYVGLYKQYLSGKRESNFILSLINTGTALGQDSEIQEIGRKYVSTLSEHDLFTKDNLRILLAVTKRIKDKGFQVFYKQPEKVMQVDTERFPLEFQKEFVGSILYNEIIPQYSTALNGGPDWKKIATAMKPYGKIGQDMLLRAKTTDAVTKMLANIKASGKPVLQPILESTKTWAEVLPKIKALNMGLGEEYLVGSTVIHYMNNMYGNFDNFYQVASYFEQQYGFMLDAGALNSWAWIVFENTMDKSLLDKGLLWAKKSLAINPDQPNALDTYANLLYKLGRKDEAIRWEQKAVDISPNEESFSLALDRMKKGEQTWPVK